LKIKSWLNCTTAQCFEKKKPIFPGFENQSIFAKEKKNSPKIFPKWLDTSPSLLKRNVSSRELEDSFWSQELFGGIINCYLIILFFENFQHKESYFCSLSF